MGDISSQALAKLIVKYLDIEKLTKDNPSVTKEMVNSFLYEISKTKKKLNRLIPDCHTILSGKVKKENLANLLFIQMGRQGEIQVKLA